MKRPIFSTLYPLVVLLNCTSRLFASDSAPVVSVAELFDLAHVRLLDGSFKDAQERDKGYILRVEPDRLMHWWRVNNGLTSTA